MSTVRNIRLFEPNGTGTPFLRAQWAQKEALEPFIARNPLVHTNRTATPYFAAIWRAAFPDREDLPKDACADDQGKGTVAFWRVFA